MGENESKIRVGRGKIDASRTKGSGTLGGLDNKAKLALAKSGVKDLLSGTRAKNRKAKSGQKPFLPTS